MKAHVRAASRCACCVIVMVILPASARASNEEPTYALSWSRAEGARDCITAQALAKAVEARLGRSVFVSPASAEFTLEARIEGAPSMWSATITLQDRDGRRVGQRDLASAEKDCRALDQSLSLMLALAIDPNAALAAEGTLPARPAPSLRPVSIPSSPAVPPRIAEAPVASPGAASPATQRVPLAYAEGAFRLAFGLLPGGAAPGVEVAAVVPIQESWVARVGGGAYLPALGQAADGGVFVSQVQASLGVCGRIRGQAAFLLLCADTEPGMVAAAGYGFNRTIEHDRRFTWLVGPSARLGVHIAGRLWGQVGGDLFVPVIRHQFYYLKADGTPVEVFRNSAVTGAASVALLLAFP